MMECETAEVCLSKKAMLHRSCPESINSVRRICASIRRGNILGCGDAVVKVSFRNFFLGLPEEKVLEVHSKVIQASKRDPLGGSRRCRKLRKESLVPGLLYGKGLHGDDSTVMLSVSRLEMRKELKTMGISFENVPYLLSVDGGEPEDAELVFPILEGRDLYSGDAITINWIRYFLGKKLRVPLVVVNEELSEDIRRGGWFDQQETHITIVVNSLDPATIPKYIEVDVTGVKAGQRINTSYLKLNEKIEIYRPEKPFPNGTVIGTVIARRRPMSAEEEEAQAKEQEKDEDEDDDDD